MTGWGITNVAVAWDTQSRAVAMVLATELNVGIVKIGVNGVCCAGNLHTNWHAWKDSPSLYGPEAHIATESGKQRQGTPGIWQLPGK